MGHMLECVVDMCFGIGINDDNGLEEQHRRHRTMSRAFDSPRRDSMGKESHPSVVQRCCGFKGISITRVAEFERPL
jgi:hypothetical protein